MPPRLFYPTEYLGPMLMLRHSGFFGQCVFGLMFQLQHLFFQSVSRVGQKRIAATAHESILASSARQKRRCQNAESKRQRTCGQRLFVNEAFCLTRRAAGLPLDAFLCRNRGKTCLDDPLTRL